ncbi:MAG: 30S ribosomal protein S4 [Armatimonadetes bacterium]|nr:30S ribosomal protein S4 [Armatimonadota bacterium]
MATYRGRKNDICRRVGFNIWGKAKCPSNKRQYANGQHGANNKDKRTSEYGDQLLQKQIIRRYYNMLEKQFRLTFDRAHRMHGNSGLNFLRLLELRLSTAVWRLGYAKTIFQARQMVSHRHICVNGKIVNISSYTLRVGDVVSVREREASQKMARENHYEGAAVPAYIEVDVAGMKGKIIALPEREDFPSFFKEQAVIEFYAR